ncbi:PREDICTED: uncharacterized protein LOC108566898 [Nicrophorus vespilloides]|uniref:Uncharacterized protein LOC108566898 n=1 Tax=Nicrophorus vespilloides TaxID=110193 RepID=A0ABM1N6Q4_NICVS|nr:PREDICTED: uncharacterized protein LOC108566898 [Nicrophorus vespilloides]
MEKEVGNLAETFAKIQAGISHFQDSVTNMNLNPTLKQVHKMEYHYKQILNKLEQVQYHMEQIEECCKIMGNVDKDGQFIRGDIVRERVRMLNCLSPSFLEPNLREFRQAESVFHKTKRKSRSENNLVSTGDRMCVDIDIDGIGKQMQAQSQMIFNYNQDDLPKVVDCLMKSQK